MKVLALIFVAVFAFGMVACGDDDDGAGGGPCDDLADAYQAAMDEVCADFPDCEMVCDPATEGEGEEPTDEECQELLDAFDHDATVELFTLGCDV